MLSVQNLHKSYQVGNDRYEVLKGVSLEVETGEFVGVMGPSGSGKSTLLNCISCYLPSDSGKIQLGGTDLAVVKEASSPLGPTPLWHPAKALDPRSIFQGPLPNFIRIPP